MRSVFGSLYLWKPPYPTLDPGTWNHWNRSTGSRAPAASAWGAMARRGARAEVNYCRRLKNYWVAVQELKLSCHNGYI